MIERLIEYQETRQFRKDRQRRQNMRYLTMMFAVLGVILVVVYIVDAFTPAEPSTPAPTVSISDKQDIEKFAYVITKPVADLTSEEIDFMGDKAKDPCYEKYALLSAERMVTKITECKRMSQLREYPADQRPRTQVSIVFLTSPEARTHLSLDGKTPLCGQTSTWPYHREPYRRGRKANCKLCRDMVIYLNRRLERPL